MAKKVYTGNYARKTAPSTGTSFGQKTSAKRHRKILKDNIRGVTKPDIRRLARRAGVKRISAAIYGETRVAICEFIASIMPKIVAILDHFDRKTVRVEDVVFALKQMGKPIWGFGPDS